MTYKSKIAKFIDPNRIDGIRNLYKDELSEIRKDPTLSEDGRRARIARSYVDATERMNRLRGELDTAVNAERNRLEKRAFGPGTVDPLERLQHRDAMERANRLGNQEEAIALLNQARISGDDALGRAVMYKANAKHWSEAINTWEAASPGTVDLLNQMHDLPDQHLNNVAAFALGSPSEFASYDSHGIKRFAEMAGPNKQVPDVAGSMGDNPFGQTLVDGGETSVTV